MHLNTDLRLGEASSLARPLRAWLLGGAAAAAVMGSPALAQPAASPHEPSSVDEVVVTGTSIRGEAPVGSNLVSLQREDIVALSVPSTADLLSKVPQLNAFGNVPRVQSTRSGANSPPGLRGLPAAATLVLIDGHRLPSNSTLNGVPDPSAIPVGAIQRVEIVADGASAIYGSDAVAGVINIITRHNLDGAETSLRVGEAQHGYTQIELSQSVGRTWSGGSAMATVAYSEHDPLRYGDFDFYTNDLRPYGGTDLRGTNCTPANIRIGTTTYVAPNYAVATGDAAKCDPAALQQPISDNRRLSFVGNVSQTWGDLHLSALLQYIATHDSIARDTPVTNLTLRPTNPFFLAPPGTNPATMTVLYSSAALFGGPVVDLAYSKQGLFATDASYSLPRDWNLTGSFSYGWGETESRAPNFDPALLTAAAAGTTTATALDPFGNRTNPAVIAAITHYENRQYAEHKIYDTTVKADGPLMSLPGGEMKLAVGVNYRSNSYDAVNPIGQIGADPAGAVVSPERSVKSVFAELFVPLVGEGNTAPLVQELNLSIAGRFDDYSDVGRTSNPKVGVTWRPVADLMIRGSYGTSFHAPDLGDLFAVGARAAYSAVSAVVPPGLSPGPNLTLTGGFPGLQPETAKTYSVGGEYAPQQLPGFRASLTYYDVLYENQIRTPPLDASIFAGGYGAFYVINPTSAQVEALSAGLRVVGAERPIPRVQVLRDLRRYNMAATHTAGFDFSISYRLTNDLGAWTGSLDGNKIRIFEVQAVAGEPFIADKGPKLRLRANLTWRRGPFRADATYSYLGAYRADYVSSSGPLAIQSVDAFKTLDLGGAYDLPDWGLMKGTTLSAKVDNLFNQDPPLELSPGGFSQLANPLGRMVWVSLLKRW